MTTLTTLYDADRRTADPDVAHLAASVHIPHPLHGIPYADGVDRCTHARRCTTPIGPATR